MSQDQGVKLFIFTGQIKSFLQTLTKKEKDIEKDMDAIENVFLLSKK